MTSKGLQNGGFFDGTKREKTQVIWVRQPPNRHFYQI